MRYKSSPCLNTNMRVSNLYYTFIQSFHLLTRSCAHADNIDHNSKTFSYYDFVSSAWTKPTNLCRPRWCELTEIVAKSKYSSFSLLCICQGEIRVSGFLPWVGCPWTSNKMHTLQHCWMSQSSQCKPTHEVLLAWFQTWTQSTTSLRACWRNNAAMALGLFGVGAASWGISFYVFPHNSTKLCLYATLLHLLSQQAFAKLLFWRNHKPSCSLHMKCNQMKKCRKGEFGI